MSHVSSRPMFTALAVALGLAALAPAAPAAVITQWSFTAVASAPDNSPAPSMGTGTAITLGMTNSYNTGNTASDDIVSTASPTNGNGITQDAWRIRGAQSPTGDNGWATAAAGAAEYSQGIELDVSTVGYTGIQFGFDWYSTNQGIRDLQVQYNTNINNPGGWTNIGGTSPTGTYIAVPNDWYSAAHPEISIDLSSIAGASNDPNFGVRLVSAFDSTGNVPNDYAGATLTGGLTTIYNNNSGNWRFDNLTISGTAPEPASLSLLAIGGILLVARRRR